MTPEPYTHAEILDSLERLRNEGLRFWSDMEPERFVAPLGDAWSPADNVRHLIKSTTPVTQALGMPALALRTMFGAAKEPSVSYSELRDRYHGLLAAGGTAGRFAPSQAVPPDDPVAWQRELVARCGTAVSDLAKAAGGPEGASARRLPPAAPAARQAHAARDALLHALSLRAPQGKRRPPPRIRRGSGVV